MLTGTLSFIFHPQEWDRIEQRLTDINTKLFYFNLVARKNNRNFIPRLTEFMDDALASANCFYPLWHLVNVSRSMMIIQNNYCQHYWRCNHEHDTIKICTFKIRLILSFKKIGGEEREKNMSVMLCPRTR